MMMVPHHHWHTRMGRVGVGVATPSTAPPNNLCANRGGGAGGKWGVSFWACELPCPHRLGAALPEQRQRLWVQAKALRVRG